MSTRSGTPFDALFDALEERVGVLVLNADDATPSQRARVVMARGGPIEIRATPYRVAGERTRYRLAHPWTATIYGPTDLEVTSLLTSMIEALDAVVGPRQGDAERETLQPHTQAPVGLGYEVKPGDIIKGGDGNAAGYACALGITLFTRVRSHIRSTVEATTPTITITPAEPSTLDAPANLQLLTG